MSETSKGKAIIIYETMTGNTELMARAILSGLVESGMQATLRRARDSADVKELNSNDAVILGSPTRDQEIISSIREFLSEMSKRDLKNRIGAAFGSCGWSGEAVEKMTEIMKRNFGMDVIKPGLKLMYTPDEDGLEKCVSFGRKIAERIERRRTEVVRAKAQPWRFDFFKFFKHSSQTQKRRTALR